MLFFQDYTVACSFIWDASPAKPNFTGSPWTPSRAGCLPATHPAGPRAGTSPSGTCCPSTPTTRTLKPKPSGNPNYSVSKDIFIKIFLCFRCSSLSFYQPLNLSSFEPNFSDFLFFFLSLNVSLTNSLFSVSVSLSLSLFDSPALNTFLFLSLSLYND